MTIQTREQSESGKGAVRVRLRRFPRCRRGDTSLGTTTRSDRQEVEGLDGRGSWSMLVVVVVLLLHRQREPRAGRGETCVLGEGILRERTRTYLVCLVLELIYGVLAVVVSSVRVRIQTVQYKYYSAPETVTSIIIRHPIPHPPPFRMVRD